MHSFIKKFAMVLAIASLALILPATTWAQHGGGGGGHGGGGFSGGGFSGGFHGGSMGGTSFHGGSIGGFSHGSFSTPHFNSGSMSNFHTFNGINHSGTLNSVNSFHGGSINTSAFRGTNHFNSFNSGVNPGHFTAGMHNHPVNPQSWTHNSNWWHSNPNWNHINNFHHVVFYPFFFGSAIWYPYWWSIGTSYGWNSYYPYCEYYGSNSYEPAAYQTAYSVPNVAQPANVEQSPPIDNQAATNEESDWGTQYLGGAHDAFRQGSYSDALRLASHAAIEMPKSPKPHELMSLAAFALKDYRGANMEAHAALAFGPSADWATLYGYYGDLPTYEKQLDALVEYVRAHKDAADARFVLAYHNLMMGHADVAKDQFEKVLAKVPQDKLAAEEYKKLGGTPPAATPPPPSPAAAVPPTEQPPASPPEDQPKSDGTKTF